MADSTYDLREWEQYRQREMSRFEEQRAAAAQTWDQWDTVAADSTPDNPPPPMPEGERPEDMTPPEIPDTPPAFDMNLMADFAEGARSFQDVMANADTQLDATLKWLKDIRIHYEPDWRRNMAYYEMAEELQHRETREADIEYLEEINRDAELEPEKMAMVLPIIFESVQILLGHDLNTMGGSTIDFCELIGGEKNDIEDAVNVQNFINYQQRTEMPTTQLLMDLILDARIFGIGWIFQDWNWSKNGRRCFVPSPFEVWCDASSTLSDSSVLVLRREMTVADLYKLRDDGMIWFSEDDLKKALANSTTIYNTMRESSMSGNSQRRSTARINSHKMIDDNVNPMYQRVYVDIQMDTEPHRWVLRVNETLTVAISKPLIPDDPTLDVQPRFPCACYAPVRKQRSILADATVTRMRRSQDFANAMATLMMENVKGSALGNWTSDDPNLDGQDIRPGVVLAHHQHSKVQQYKTDMNAQLIMGVIDWIGDRNSDRVSGVTEAFRGQQQYAGQTATAIRDLLGQSTNRIGPQEALARDCMQDYYEIAITLNRLYLSPHKYFRIVESQYANTAPGVMPDGRPITAGDFIGVSGKDLVPTGFAGSTTALTQEALNESAVIAQIGGNPQPLMKQYLQRKYQGRVDVDAIFPANGVGNDPVQENELILNGMAVSRDPDDNDQTHVVTHMQLLVDPRFQQAAQMNPALVGVLQAHIGLHQQELMKLTALMGGMPAGVGLGTSGTGTTLSPTANPKSDADREAQMTAQGAPAR